MYRQLNFRAGRFGLFTWFVTDFDRIKTWFIKLKFRRATKCSAAAADRKCGWLGGAPHFVRRRRRRKSVSAGGGGEIRRLRGLALADHGPTRTGPNDSETVSGTGLRGGNVEDDRGRHPCTAAAVQLSA